MVDLTFSKRKLRAIIKRTITVIVILALASLFYKSKPIAFGVILGGGVSVINLFVLGKLVEAILQQPRTTKTFTLLGYLVQIALLFGIVYFTATREMVHLGAFAIGFSAFMFGAFIETIFPSHYSPQE
jgi:hypothetical protein